MKDDLASWSQPCPYIYVHLLNFLKSFFKRQKDVPLCDVRGYLWSAQQV